MPLPRPRQQHESAIGRLDARKGEEHDQQDQKHPGPEKKHTSEHAVRQAVEVSPFGLPASRHQGAFLPDLRRARRSTVSLPFGASSRSD